MNKRDWGTIFATGFCIWVAYVGPDIAKHVHPIYASMLIGASQVASWAKGHFESPPGKPKGE